MLSSFFVVVPVFAVIAMGWAAARFAILRQETGNGISDYVFVIAIPLMLLRTLATAPLPPAPPWSFWASYFLGLAAVWTLAAVISRRGFGKSEQEAAILGFTAAQSNMVMLGIPLVLRAFGDEGAVPLFLMVAVHLPVVMTVATIQIERAEAGESKARTILMRLARNPIIIGMAAGATFRLSGAPMPDVLLNTLKFIGDSAAPCALFATGMSLSRYGFGSEPRLLSIIVPLKLVAQPLLVFLLARFVFVLPPVWTGVATVLAGCPCGVNAFLLAERYRTGMGITSGAVLLSTLLALATTTFLVWLVRP